MKKTIVCLLAALVSLSPACGDDDSRPAECEEIVEACHDVDPGSGEIHECHEGAESDWSRDMCVAMRADCLAACTAQDAGVAR